MNFYQFIIILMARKKIAFFALLITVLTTLVLSLILPKTYQANTALILNYKGVDSVTGLVLPAQLLPGYMATQIDIISSKNVALKVVEKLELDKSPVAIESYYDATNGEGNIKEWLAYALLKNLDVQPSRESSVIYLSFSGSDPNFAAVVANAFSDAYIETNLQLKVEPSVRAAEWFNQQAAILRENMITAQNRLSSYQRDKGIVSLDQRLDVETSRLAQISNQLVAAQAESFDSMSRQNQASNSDNIDQNPDILNNSLLQSMKAELSRAEANLAEVRQRLNTNHPLYKSSLAEVLDLRNKLNAELKRVTSSLGKSANISEQRVQELENALNLQKERILTINQQRDEMSVLQQDVESAQKALDIALQRYSQTSMEGQANQSDVSVLNVASPPSSHSSPRLLINMILSLFMGSILAIGVALLAELLDRRVRTENDIQVGLGIPVLGVLKYQLPKARWWKNILA